jgi:hypothetical protein
MVTDNGGKSTNRTSRVKLLALVFVFLTLVFIILSVYAYYLPLKDIEVRVISTYQGSEWGHDYISLRLNVTNKGSLSHMVHLTGKIIFNSQPDMVFTGRTNLWEIPPMDWHDPGFPIYVYVPNELFQTPYEASCSVTLLPFVNEYSTPWIVLPGVVWLVGLAAVAISLVRSRRQAR